MMWTWPWMSKKKHQHEMQNLLVRLYDSHQQRENKWEKEREVIQELIKRMQLLKIKWQQETPPRYPYINVLKITIALPVELYETMNAPNQFIEYTARYLGVDLERQLRSLDFGTVIHQINKTKYGEQKNVFSPNFGDMPDDAGH